MPHLIVEYSSNLAGFPKAQALRELNLAVSSSHEVLNEADLKTRIVALDSYEIGSSPAARAFVHAQLRLLSGRTPEVKKDLGARRAAVLRQLTSRPEGVVVNLSDELVDSECGPNVQELI